MISNEIIKKYRDSGFSVAGDDELTLWQTLQELARLVVNRHFWYLTPDQKEDGLSEAVCGALEGLRQSWVDLEHNSPVNYVYTRMRNCLTNYFRNQLRFDTVEVPGDLFDLCEDPTATHADETAMRVAVTHEYQALVERLAFFSCGGPDAGTYFENGMPVVEQGGVMSPASAAFVVASHRGMLATDYLPEESV